MSNNEPQEHLHLLSSNEAGWNGLQLIYEREPADEIPENWFTQHLLLIFLEDVQANFMGSWQLLVILVGVRQKAEGRRQKGRKKGNSRNLYGTRVSKLLPSASCLLP